MFGRYLLQLTATLAATALLLMVSAGTTAWPQAWLYLALMAASGIAIGVWLLRNSPGLLQERTSRAGLVGQRAWDRLYLLAVVILFPAWLVVMGLERRATGHASFPVWAQVLGGLMVAAGMTLTWLTYRANSFAAGAIKLQAERGHYVVTSGPYAVIRHPLYAGAALWMFGASLLMGAAWGLPVSLIAVIVIAVRAVAEERFLVAHLAGYSDYLATVRFRLLPGVW